MALTGAEVTAAARACPRWLSGTRSPDPEQELRSLAAEAALGGEPDRYGEGGLVEEVEEQVRELLGAPAAVLCPSGTLAQQVALRHWCDETGSPRVGLHATAHPVLHENDALPVVQGLVPVVVGDRPELAAVVAAHERSPLGALLVELPQRETGGDLLALDALTGLSQWCRAEGVRLHLDGARLWECGPAYAPRSLAQVVALADSTYVSLYKGLGGPAGAVLLGRPGWSRTPAPGGTAWAGRCRCCGRSRWARGAGCASSCPAWPSGRGTRRRWRSRWASGGSRSSCRR